MFEYIIICFLIGYNLYIFNCMLHYRKHMRIAEKLSDELRDANQNLREVLEDYYVQQEIKARFEEESG